MTYAIAYILALVMFSVLDMVWLTTMGAKLYRSTLGDILVDDIRKLPAIAFYLMYPAGLVLFAAAPGIKSGSASMALIYGALFGLFTYGTYEFTNYATLRAWTMHITVIDLAYGVIVSGLVAFLVAMVAPAASNLFEVR